MNSVSLVGRITKDLELKYTTTGKAVVSFTLAVNRTFNRDEADFISCVAWQKTAETLCNYMGKGSQIGITGRIQTRTYDDKDGKRVYITEVVANEIEFLDSKKSQGAEQQQTPKKKQDADLSEFQALDDDEEIPF